MLHIALYQPEIPPNTGNIIRLAANTGFKLHLIHPLGFELDDKRLKRAGLDYHEWSDIVHHCNEDDFFKQMASKRIFACSTKGQRCYASVDYQGDDVLLFGPETRGLPQTVLSHLPREHILRIPMQAQSRSLNLSNACAVIAYEAWRQLKFIGT